jgi:hypothetical protein
MKGDNMARYPKAAKEKQVVVPKEIRKELRNKKLRQRAVRAEEQATGRVYAQNGRVVRREVRAEARRDAAPQLAAERKARHEALLAQHKHFKEERAAAFEKLRAEIAARKAHQEAAKVVGQLKETPAQPEA